MNRLREIKWGLAAGLAVITGLLGDLAMPVLVLVLLNGLDYGTGLLAAPFRHQRVSSYQGLRGIAKKVSMWLLVGMGAVVDWLLNYTGVPSPLEHLVSCAVAIWLIVNELISILENIGDTGVPVPAFLEKIIALVKEKNL